MGKKTKDGVRVRFVGTNNEDVTGSCTHIQSKEVQILLECGLYQSCGDVLGDYRVNSRKFDFKPKEIDYVFVGHNHIDHIGLLPRLYKFGCTAKIIAPKNSLSIARELILNSAGIINRDSECLTKSTGKFCEPLYTLDDVETMFEHWCEYEVDEVIELDDNVKFKLLYSQHILNACQLELWIKSGNTIKKIGYTSDLGNISVDNNFAQKFQPIEKCNILIGECTYNKKQRGIGGKDRLKDLEKIELVVRQTCLEKRGKVFVPSFANARLQQILFDLYSIFGKDDEFKTKIIVDTPLGSNITKLYAQELEDEDKQKFRDMLSWSNLVFTTSHEESQKYMASKEPIVAIASSGFLVAGRSVNWIKSILPKKNNHVLFVGFSPASSVAGIIKEGKKESVKINGKPIRNKCNITDLKSYSSHMQYEDLLNYYSNVNCEKVALVHGEFSGKLEFAKELQEEISKKNKTSKVVIVNKSTEILL